MIIGSIVTILISVLILYKAARLGKESIVNFYPAFTLTILSIVGIIIGIVLFIIGIV